jgi:hypothetical protein
VRHASCDLHPLSHPLSPQPCVAKSGRVAPLWREGRQQSDARRWTRALPRFTSLQPRQASTRREGATGMSHRYRKSAAVTVYLQVAPERAATSPLPPLRAACAPAPLPKKGAGDCGGSGCDCRQSNEASKARRRLASSFEGQDRNWGGVIIDQS